MKNSEQMLLRARELRREMTPHERKLWYLFLRKYPVKIYRQKILDRYTDILWTFTARRQKSLLSSTAGSIMKKPGKKRIVSGMKG